MFIEDRKSLEDLCLRHRGKSPVGFDTEFVREKTYYPRLEIFQIVVAGEIDVIDVQTIDDLEPLWELLCDPATEKVVHSGMQDMELIFQESGRLPAPVLDTQIAASLVGLGAQCGYGRLVYNLLGKKTPKGETFSDWGQRPLHPEQLRYAEADVLHLLDLHRVLMKKLDRMGRGGWLVEECGHLCDPETFRRHAPDECFMRIKGRNGLDPTSLSILRSLAEWREEESRQRDLPPNRMFRDHNLLSIAKAKPTAVEELKRIRGMHVGEINRFGAELLEQVAKGAERAKEDPVDTPEGSRNRPDAEPDGLFKLLGAVLQIQAEEAKIAPSMLANGQELQDFMCGFRRGDLNGHPLLKGWRRELAGARLLAVLEGKVSLRVDPEHGTLILEELDRTHGS